MKFIANPVEVDAWEILTVNNLRDKPPSEPQSCMLLLVEPGERANFNASTLVEERRVTPEMTARYWPKPGDYLVRQADGYEYLNPREVFHRKYRPASLSDVDAPWWKGMMPSDEVAGPAKAAKPLTENTPQE